MIQNKLKEDEIVIYQSLKNALNNQRLGHSFLLTGEKNPLIHDTAILLAQSIIENKNDFACEECDTCKRIKANNYFDVYIIDGEKEAIKKKDIEEMFERFKTSSLEGVAKIYIIKDIDNSNAKVLNMILKYMEEPPNDKTYAILETNHIERLLDTIISRCQLFKFHKVSDKTLIDLYLKDGFDIEDANILVEAIKEYRKLDLNDEIYMLAKDMVYKTVEYADRANYLEMTFYNELYNKYKTADKVNLFLEYYLNMMLVYLNHRLINDKSVFSDLALIKVDIAKAIDIYLEFLAKIKVKQYDRKLLIDELICELGKISI